MYPVESYCALVGSFGVISTELIPIKEPQLQLPLLHNFPNMVAYVDTAYFTVTSMLVFFPSYS
jgi:hypothetical protein